MEGRRCPIPRRSTAPYRLYNIGNNNPVELLQFIGAIEARSVARPCSNLLPMQPGDVPATYADVDDLSRDVGFAPDTPIEVGVPASSSGIASTTAAQ